MRKMLNYGQKVFSSLENRNPKKIEVFTNFEDFKGQIHIKQKLVSDERSFDVDNEAYFDFKFWIITKQNQPFCKKKNWYSLCQIF